MRTRSELSDESIRQADASLIFVKLRKMIASDVQPTDTILGTIAVAAHSLTGATGAAIAMPRDGAVVCVGRSGETAPELGDRLNVDSGISGECMRTGVIMRCDDASRDFHVDAEVCRELGLQSIAVVPLRGQHGRVGVLEAFSTQSYAFTEDKMELLGRLAGLAEAAWARGAVTEDRDTVVGDTEVEDTEVRDREAGAATVEIEALVEAPLETTPALPVPVPLAKVREVFAAVPRDDPFAGKKWRYAAMAGLTLLVLTLASWYGWKAWYKASVASRASHSAASPQGSPTARQNPAGAGFAGTPDVVRPESRPRPGAGSAKSGSVRPASSPVVPGVSVQRRPRSAQSRDGSGTDSSGSSPTQADAVDAPQIAASSADPADLGKVLSASPTLPKLGVPISQGVSGGVLLHKVQPVYPPEARRTRLEGSVVLDAMVTVKGEVDDLKLVSGDPMLAQAAMDAVRQWRYSPYSLNGTPIPKPTRITISFIAPQ